MQYCSLQLQTLLLSPVTSTTGYCFCFGSIPSFFLELFLHWSPVAYWAPTDLGSSSFSVLSFCLFILFMWFSGKNSEVVCHSLLQWTTFCQTSPPWPDHLGWPHMAWLRFMELDKTVVRVINCTIALISHASKVMLKILQARLQQYVNCELPDVQAGFRKGRGTRDQLPTSAGSSRKQKSYRKTSISALLTMPKTLTVWISTNCGKFLKR